MVSVRILYASEHHSTQEIASRIGSRLRTHGHRVEVRALDSDPGRPWLHQADALVLGSAVHDGAWLPSAEAAVRARTERLREQPVWMFSVGMSAALPKPLRLLADRAVQPRIAALVDVVRPREHRRFSGVIRREHLDRRGAVLFRLLGCRYGDHRDWAAVEAWADDIAGQLKELPGHGPVQ
ncbi:MULTISPECIES: flavodoxin domain-containing protein [Streptomyces]|uniref:flavodoxin domain-containing protein n=1 Tax=Streptomyces TaxID=1883 RepID=UPI0004C4BF10|nr:MULTISPECIES: flavodoxin domain-containing protein [Streptomyces]RPK88510.1 protoporphyrinogen oxidase [Streptomyces sp. ADI98-10]